MRHVFPWFGQRLNAFEDPRDDPLYSVAQVQCLTLLMFASRIRSLRLLDELSHDAQFRDNWCVFSRARTDTVICSRQMTNVLAVLDLDVLSALRPELLRTLLRQKQAPDLYLLGHVMMAVDATGVFSSDQPHCPQCLTQHHQDGSTTYLHNVLECKALGRNGLALSVLSEPLLNPEDGHYDKQDCETKAFHRALPRLKEQFPRLRIVCLLDSLYCQSPIFDTLARLDHRFICCFKRGSIPTLYDDALELMKRAPLNRLACTLQRDGHRVRQLYTWVNGLAYQGHTLDFVRCEETVEGKTTTFAYLTDFTVTRDNVITIAQGGRLRWKIENEGFNEQKTGYELEHFCDCKTLEVMLALYYLLQIAHLLMQLLARSNLIETITHLTVLAYLLLESLRNQPLSEDLFHPRQPRCQIRFAQASP